MNMDLVNRRIRSYVCRRGTTTKGQRRAFLDYAEKWILPYQNHNFLDFQQIFSDNRPVTLEIGFGAGDATAHIALANPDHGYIGVEVYPSGVGKLLMYIEELELTNIRIIQHDAVEVLRDMLAPKSLAGVHVFFPDPWPKKRHHKRRLLQPHFVHEIASRIQTGGYFYFVTDWQEYAQQVLEICQAEPLLKNPYQGFAPAQEWRPKTRFQMKGEDAQRQIFEVYMQHC